jgi:hypothetical protein
MHSNMDGFAPSGMDDGFEDDGFDGFEDDGLEAEGLDGDGFEEDGFEEDGFEADGLGEDGFEGDDLDDGFDEDGFEDGFEDEAFEADGLDDGFDEDGFEDGFEDEALDDGEAMVSALDDAMDAADENSFWRRALSWARQRAGQAAQWARQRAGQAAQWARQHGAAALGHAQRYGRAMLQGYQQGGLRGAMMGGLRQGVQDLPALGQAAGGLLGRQMTMRTGDMSYAQQMPQLGMGAGTQLQSWLMQRFPQQLGAPPMLPSGGEGPSELDAFGEAAFEYGEDDASDAFLPVLGGLVGRAVMRTGLGQVARRVAGRAVQAVRAAAPALRNVGQVLRQRGQQIAQRVRGAIRQALPRVAQAGRQALRTVVQAGRNIAGRIGSAVYRVMPRLVHRVLGWIRRGGHSIRAFARRLLAMARRVVTSPAAARPLARPSRPGQAIRQAAGVRPAPRAPTRPERQLRARRSLTVRGPFRITAL